jgi:hypothetical protein
MSRPIQEERGFGVLLLIALPTFIVLVVINRLVGSRVTRTTPSGEQQGILREAIEWARSTIAVGLQN